MHVKSSAIAAAALAATQVTALNSHRHRHAPVDRRLAERNARANEARALVYAHTTTTWTTETVTVTVTIGDDDVAPTAAFFEGASTDSSDSAGPEVTSDAGAQPEPETPDVVAQDTPESSSPAAVVDVAQPTTSSSQPAYTPPVATVPTTGCKRGIAYNDGGLTPAFTSSDSICWGYNWGSSGSLSGAEYVPLLWGNKDNFFDVWPSNCAAAIAAGSKHALSFNEPDMESQAGAALYDWTVAAAEHKRLMGPIKAQGISIGSPAVTSDWNSNGSNGLYRSYHWLKKFIEACGADCPMDFAVTHFYGDCNVEIFKNYIAEFHSNIGLPVWVTEFQGQCDEASQAEFIRQTAAWMDSDPRVVRYSYFYVDGTLTTGGSPNALGAAYISA